MIAGHQIGICCCLLLLGGESAAFSFVQRRSACTPSPSPFIGILQPRVQSREGRHAFRRILLNARATDSSESAGLARDLSPLEEWGVNNKIEVSSSISLKLESDDGGSSTNYGVTLTKSSKEYETILSVPKEVVLDSEFIRREWEGYISPSLEFIETSGLHDSTSSFVLMVKILKEYSLGEKSKFYEWISTLPKIYDTGVCMDEVERSCLPPFALKLANFETEQLVSVN